MLDHGAPAGPWPFTCKVPYKVALVKSPSAFPLRRLVQLKSPRAFRLRRLAQSVCLRSGLTLGPGIVPVNSRTKAALVKC